MRVLKIMGWFYLAQAAVGIAVGLWFGVYMASVCGAGDLTCVLQEIETWKSKIV